MKGFYYQRVAIWTYCFRSSEHDLSTGGYPWISERGLLTQKQAPKAPEDAMRNADAGRFVQPSAWALAEFFAAMPTSFGAIAWPNWNDYVLPRIGGAPLQRLDEPQLQKLSARPLTKGRVKRDQDHETFHYWTVPAANHYGNKGN